MSAFVLRFDKNLIPYWASRFNEKEDALIENEIAPQVRARGYLTRDEFLTICHWKSPRTRKHIEGNNEEFIQAVSQTALSTANEQLRISILTLLRGVNWPTASVILHFCHTDLYPILDFRALWSLSVDVPAQYNFDFWWSYTGFCRKLAIETGESMRRIDRALWQYAKDHQG